MSIRAPSNTILSRRFLISDRGFFRFACLLALVTLILLRLVVGQVIDYRRSNKSEVYRLLTQRSFPQRREEYEVMVAAVNSGLQRPVVSNSSTRLEARLHDSFLHLSKALQQRPGVAEQAASLDAARELVPNDQPALAHALHRAMSRFRDSNDNETIVPCFRLHRRDSTLSPHELLYGQAGCDATAGTTKLLVASRAFRPDAPLGGPVYGPRLLNQNDFSLVLESILHAVADSLPTRRDYAEQSWTERVLVQAYFISPDGLLRYWDISNRQPYLDFGASPFWGATPFIEVLLDRHEVLLNTKDNVNPSEIQGTSATKSRNGSPPRISTTENTDLCRHRAPPSSPIMGKSSVCSVPISRCPWLSPLLRVARRRVHVTADFSGLQFVT